MTLEKVNKNADLRQKQSLELTNQLKNTNWLVYLFIFLVFSFFCQRNYEDFFSFYSVLMKTLERCKRKSQLRLRKLETEMFTMMDKHAAQVKLSFI